MFSWISLLGFARKLRWREWLIIAVAGAMVFLWIRGNRYRGQYHDQLQINHQLEWDKSIAEAKFDSIKGIGEYSEIRVDTVESPYPVPGSEWYDTLYLESGDLGPQSVTVSQVKIDTSKWFGPEGERFGVRVYGVFHWPQQYAYRNRLLIDPLGFEKTPQLPVQAQSRYGWGINPTIAWKSQDALYTGLVVYAGRVSVIGLTDFKKPSWIVGIGFRIF